MSAEFFADTQRLRRQAEIIEESHRKAQLLVDKLSLLSGMAVAVDPVHLRDVRSKASELESYYRRLGNAMGEICDLTENVSRYIARQLEESTERMKIVSSKALPVD